MTAGRAQVVLFEPEIAANVGAIGRTCVAAGATLWLVRPLGFRLDDKQRRRAGLDYWDRLDVRLVDGLDQVVEALGPDTLWSFTTKASRRLWDARFVDGDALIFGPESRGLPAWWRDAQPPDRLLRIPMTPEARSLNLASAVAIGLYEAIRQLDGIS
ncbi:MAG: tRNA (cytidine(34)-2'-O)-methyltransferase [Isosphaeraceae bacterium]